MCLFKLELLACPFANKTFNPIIMNIFIKNKFNPIRLLTAITLLMMFALPLAAQEKEDSVFTFRFFTGRDMFFVPIMGNGEELARLFDCVDRYKDKITSHDIMLYVNGYCQSKASTAEKMRVAKIRSNRVKSELIVRKGLKEDNFVTRNHLGDGNYVTVSLVVNKKDIIPSDPEVTFPKNEEPEVVAPVAPVVQPVDSVAEPEPAVEPAVVVEPVEVSEPVLAPSVVRPDSRFALKTNLLGYAVLMPNLEVEWMFVDRWSLALEGQGAWYAKNEPHKVYRLATLTPEIRFWALDRGRWHGMYVGLFGGAGLYDLSNGKKGHEGEGWMAGVSAGYMWPISKHLSLDAGIGVGYMHARDKVYEPRDGHFLYQMTKNVNYFGPLRAKLSLVWRIPSYKKQTVK